MSVVFLEFEKLDDTKICIDIGDISAIEQTKVCGVDRTMIHCRETSRVNQKRVCRTFFVKDEYQSVLHSIKSVITHTARPPALPISSKGERVTPC